MKGLQKLKKLEMSYLKLINKVNDFEKENDVSKFCYLSFNIWHLIKSEIHLNFREINNRTPTYGSLSVIKRIYFKLKLKVLKHNFNFNKIVQPP